MKKETRDFLQHKFMVLVQNTDVQETPGLNKRFASHVTFRHFIFLCLLNLNHVHLLLEARGYSASCLVFVKVTLQSEVSHICMFNRCLVMTVKTGNALLMIKEILCTTFILCIRRYISSSQPFLYLQEETVGLFLGHVLTTRMSETSLRLGLTKMQLLYAK